MFCIAQADLPAPDKNQVDDANAALDALRARKQELSEECVKVKQRRLDTLAKMPATSTLVADAARLRAEIDKLNNDIAAAELAVQNLPPVNATQAAATETKLRFVQAEEKRLKRLFDDIAADFAAHLGLSKQGQRDWLDEIGTNFDVDPSVHN